MNNNTNAWAVTVGNSKFSEAVQRIAFSFEYQWGDFTKSVKHTDVPVLYFTPGNKYITYGTSRDGLEDQVCKVVNTLEEVIENFNNPPSNTSVSIGKFQFYRDGSVLVGQMGRSVSIHKEEFDEAVVARNKFLGREKKNKKRRFPIVKFKYDSKSSKKKEVRRIILLEETEDIYSGLDMNDMKNPNSYKVFRKDCVLGDIQFIGLSEEKEW